MLVTASAFREPWEAHMFRARLAAEGIPGFVCHEYHVGNAWYLSVGLGGVKVQVPADRWAEARAVERLCVDGVFASLLEQEFGTLDVVCCPHCGSTKYWKRRPLPRAAMAISISFLCGPLLPPQGWIYFCETCGKRFRAAMCPVTMRKLATILAVVACQLVALTAIMLCIGSLFTRHWLFGVVVMVMLTARWLIKRISAMEDRPSA